MSAAVVQPREHVPPADARFRILAIDGGGIRGIIPARLLARLEALLAGRPGAPTLADSFDLIAGTSTGGLLALGLTVPGADGRPTIRAADLVELYSGEEARQVFRRSPVGRVPLLGGLIDLLRPKYSLGPLRELLESRFGEATMGDALTEVLITSYDMRGRTPRFFKRWRSADARVPMVDAALATAAAPTFFPAHELAGDALVDGGIFAANPTIAAIAEALKRTTDPAATGPDDLLAVSLGTGRHETGFTATEVARWGAADWVLPKRGEPPLIAAMLDGQSDAADHWAHVILNHEPGRALVAAEGRGAGPRYYRYQIELPRPHPLDDTSPTNIGALLDHADALIEARSAELEALASALAPR